MRIFENLVENALKYGASDERVDIALNPGTSIDGEPEAQVSVRDYGPGIAPEHLPRLTERFYRVDVTESRAQGGTGLGLALVKHILNRHGGRLTIESTAGQGATFTVRLPIGEAAAVPEDGPEGAAGHPAPPAASRRPLRILLVEDHRDTAVAMTDLLLTMGHQVTAASGVAEGLAAAAAAFEDGAGGLDLVISDLGLPDGDGHHLMRELSRRYHLRGIALSGYGMEEDIRRSQVAGFERHLTKPVTWQLLQAVIDETTSSS